MPLEKKGSSRVVRKTEEEEKMNEYTATYTGEHVIKFSDLVSVKLDLIEGDIVDLTSMSQWLSKKRKERAVRYLNGDHKWLDR